MPARFNFPLFLTWCRIVAIPLFVAVLYVPEDWIAEKSRNLISMWIFIGAAVTDWLDGYLARVEGISRTLAERIYQELH